MAVNFEGKPPAGISSDALGARARAEAQYYSLLNPYLNDRQKAIIEAWFQLPAIAFTYSYLASSLFSDALPVRPVFCAVYFSLAVGWLVTTAANEVTLERLVPIVAIGNNVVISFGLIFLVAFTGNISWPSAIGIAVLSVTGLPNAGIQLASAWATAKYPKLHPKYGAAKVIFRREGSPPVFAFERYLEASGSSSALDDASAKGKVVLCWISLALLIIATVMWG